MSPHLQRIERQVGQLDRVLAHTQMSIMTFCPHGQAIMQLRSQLAVAVNLLNDRPADHDGRVWNSTPGPPSSPG